MTTTESVTIQKRELLEFKEWAKKKNKKIVEIVELGKESIKVMIEDN